ncbi:MAG: coiled-coil domain-containing family 149 protein [Lachnospiraceae bacterium]|nr:coiled-coil domain-containing family 149 protein [Lachnospiraceae bacterium]
MIPTGIRGRKKAETKDAPAKEESRILTQLNDLQNENRYLKEKITSLEKELSDASRQIQKYRTAAHRIEELAAKLS